MNLGLFLTLYAISVPTFVLIDMLWLGVVANSFYQNHLWHLTGDVNWTAAVIFYLLFLIGLTFFALYPGAVKGSLLAAVVLGGLYGFFTYATYDLTNLATIKDWPVLVTVVDIAWGTVLGASVAGITFYIHSLLL